MNKRRIVWPILLVLALNAAGPGQAAEKGGRETYVLAGSGTSVALTQVLARAFMEKNPGVRLDIPESIGSTGGANAVHKGKIRMALLARPLRGIEQTWNLKVVPYARTILVFGTHPSVPDDNLTADQVVEIFGGRFVRWKDGSPVRVLIREEGDSGADVVVRRFPGMKEILADAYRSGIWRIEYKDLDCNRSLERLAGAVCWTDLGSIRLHGCRVKSLRLDGVEPTAANLASGAYPLYKELFFAYAEPLPETLQKFIAFVKSEEGKAIIAKSDYVPVP